MTGKKEFFEKMGIDIEEERRKREADAAEAGADLIRSAIYGRPSTVSSALTKNQEAAVHDVRVTAVAFFRSVRLLMSQYDTDIVAVSTPELHISVCADAPNAYTVTLNARNKK